MSASITIDAVPDRGVVSWTGAASGSAKGQDMAWCRLS